MARKSKKLPKLQRLHIQIAIRGKGVQRLSQAALSELVRRTVDGQEPPYGIDVDLHVWRGNVDIDWRDDTPNAGNLRTMIRGLLQGGSLQLSIREN